MIAADTPVPATVCVVLALALSAVPGAAQSFDGVVLDDATGQPVPGTFVVLLDSAGTPLRSMESDRNGRFSFSVRRAGTYKLEAERLGYEVLASEPLRVRAGDVLELELRLASRPIRLAPLTVTTQRRRIRLERVGFYRRQDMGIGRFMTAEHIDTRPQFGVTDLLRTEPSVRMLYDPDRLGWVATFRGAASMRWETAPCLPLLVLDGTRVMDSRWLDELVQPPDIAAIELYPSGNGAPVQYTGLGAPCGVILIWTKRS